MCVFNRPRRADSSVSQSVSCPTVIEAGWQARQATTKKKKKRRRSRLTRFRTGLKRRRSGQLIAAVVEVGHFLRLHCKGTFFAIVFAPSHSTPLDLVFGPLAVVVPFLAASVLFSSSAVTHFLSRSLLLAVEQRKQGRDSSEIFFFFFFFTPRFLDGDEDGGGADDGCSDGRKSTAHTTFSLQLWLELKHGNSSNSSNSSRQQPTSDHLLR